MTNTPPPDSPRSAVPDPGRHRALARVLREREFQRAREELSDTEREIARLRSELDRAAALRWNRIGAKVGLVRCDAFGTSGEAPPTSKASAPVTDEATDRQPERARELDDVRAQVAVALAERDRLRAAYAKLQSSRWTDIGRHVRRGITRARSHARRTRATLRHTPATDPRTLFEERQFEDALRVVDEGLGEDPLDTELLTLRTQVLVRMGELTAALESARRLEAVTRSAAHRAQVETIAGRLRELDHAWFPDLGSRQETLPPTETRILHILKESRPFYERGYTMRSHYVLRAQRDAGLRPAVVTSLGFPRLDGFTEFPSIDVLDGVPHHRLDLGPDYHYRRVPNDRFLLDYARQASRVVASVRPSVIHANSGYRGFETALVGISLGRHFGLPVVYDVRSFLEATWTPDIERSELGEHYRLRLQRERSCMEAADLVFTIATTMRDEIARRGIDPDKIVVIPNAVDADEFVPREADSELVRDLGFVGKTVLGYISNIGQREGVDILVEAMSLLVRDGRNDVGCLIVGDGPQLAAVREQIVARGLSGAVRAVGHVPHAEIQRYYSVIDLFVVPRRADEAARFVTPLKPFEAMAMQRPLLVANLPALTEVTGSGERGLVFTPEVPASLAAQAEQLIDAPGLRAELARAGRQWVVRERSWAANGQRYSEAYGRLTAEVRR